MFTHLQPMEEKKKKIVKNKWYKNGIEVTVSEIPPP